MSLAAKAEIIARTAHEHQVDKAGEPYVLHLEAVAGAVSSDEEKAVAWLHDIIEDTPIGPQDLRNMTFPEYIVEAVLLLTHTHESTRREYLVRIRDAPGRAGDYARRVKIADLTHNMSAKRTLPGSEGTRMKRRYQQDLRWLLTFCEHCGKGPTAADHDPCIADLPGVYFACCGHGGHGSLSDGEGTLAYVVEDQRTLYGGPAIERMRELGGNPPDFVCPPDLNETIIEELNVRHDHRDAAAR